MISKIKKKNEDNNIKEIKEDENKEVKVNIKKEVKEKQEVTKEQSDNVKRLVEMGFTEAESKDAIEKNNTAAQNPPATPDRNLKLSSFRAFPNPTGGQLTIAFNGEQVATTVSMFDASGRQLFREEMNAFGGDYYQQFDLSEYAKGTIVVQVQQGEKLYSEQIIVN